MKRWFKQFGHCVSETKSLALHLISTQHLGSLLAASLLLSCALVLPVQSKGSAPAVDAQIESIAQAELPKQARETYALILTGGPFPYEKDGSVFGNRERALPSQKRGYYREYTVKTPYSRDRGARRIVCGGLQPKQPESCYFTPDHYASFKRITP